MEKGRTYHKGDGPNSIQPGFYIFMSVVICDALSLYGVEASVKWPNDVLVARAKIAGMLS